MTVIQHLLFVRHGETVGNLEQIAHGQTESPLNPRGVKQALRTAEMLTNWEREYHHVYASPMSRAHQTGKHIAEALNLPISTHEGLKEGWLGDWEGVTYAELDELGFARHSIKDDDFLGHNGESPNMLGTRMEKAVTEIRHKHPADNLIFVSHGAAIAHFLARLMETRPAFGHQYLMHNAAVTEVRIAKGIRPEITTLNEHQHLPEDLKVDPTKRNAQDSRR